VVLAPGTKVTAPRDQQRLQVVQVLYSGLGGHASVAFSLIDGDRDQQWRSSLLFVGIEDLALVNRARCEVDALRFAAVRSTPGRPWHAWRRVYAALRALTPDVVVLHSISSLPPVAVYCFLHRKKLFAVLHTSIALRSRAEVHLANLASVFAKRVVVLTDAYRDAYLATAGLFRRPSKVAVIPNGVNVDTFSASTEGGSRSGETFRIGMAARFSSTKRQDVLVDALKLLLEQRPDVPWTLTLAGDGEQLASVKRRVEVVGIAGRVECVGYLDEAGLVKWLRSLDIYAHASEGEGLSTSMLQAMAMALPIVATDVPGIGNLLSQAPHLGVLIGDNTGPAFAAGIEAVQADPALRAQLGTAARACVIDKYSSQTMFNSYNQIIKGPSH